MYGLHWTGMLLVIMRQKKWKSPAFAASILKHDDPTPRLSRPPLCCVNTITAFIDHVRGAIPSRNWAQRTFLTLRKDGYTFSNVMCHTSISNIHRVLRYQLSILRYQLSKTVVNNIRLQNTRRHNQIRIETSDSKTAIYAIIICSFAQEVLEPC